MSETKKILFDELTVMSEDEAMRILEYLIAGRRANWNNIPEEDPDEIDLAMLRDIEADPECKEFLSAEESRKVLWG